MNNIPRIEELTPGVFKVEVLRGKTSWAMAFCEGATAIKSRPVVALLITDDPSFEIHPDKLHMMTVTAEGVRYLGNELSQEMMLLAFADISPDILVLDIANTPMERQEVINIAVGKFVWNAGYNVLTYTVEQAPRPQGTLTGRFPGNKINPGRMPGMDRKTGMPAAMAAGYGTKEPMTNEEAREMVDKFHKDHPEIKKCYPLPDTLTHNECQELVAAKHKCMSTRECCATSEPKTILPTQTLSFGDIVEVYSDNDSSTGE